MLHRTYDDQNCSIARALEIVGERWTLLIIRDAFEGVRRFDDFQADLGVARNVLTDRLSRLCDEGILRRHRYQERPDRYEYRLTRKGVGLWPAMMSLLLWGDQHYAEDGSPVVLTHRGCTGRLTPALTCSECGAAMGPTDVEPRPGPGARPTDRIVQQAGEAAV
ncbi:winged helix-turn-helix transcriptional regulator [Actinoallomurus rhizosphaericola]|uniref:winged helix-turn-helix transcriptional regulator n=1 Tax=Actinoallomurus rhizosphaericola TaxID=2952536 RepID=UPI002093677C|nr:helix-turn-helix domain-containing protein [Actinoallomurus rhizosphaericola]MCO5997439.1 helix-turn-helix transcriptional regulator [Actinoallomurus rhizosphaericola]